MMTMQKKLLSIVCAIGLSASAIGCSSLSGVTGIFGASEPFTASVCATGAIVIPCKDLGTINIPAGGQGLLTLVVQLAGPMLAKTANLKGCAFTAYPPEQIDTTLRATASANCLVNGMHVEENVILTLTPVVS